VVITFINITALKRSEEQLLNAKETLEERVMERTRELDEAHQQVRHTRDLFHALFNTNPIPTVLMRMDDDVFLNVNVEFLNYFNLQRDEIIGRSSQEVGLRLSPEQDRTARQKFNAHVKKMGRIRNHEMEIKRPSGEKRTVLASIQYISIDNTDALITAFIDITDRVRAEQQIRLLAYDLTMAEQVERHRISQILHDDLQQRIFAVKMQMLSLFEEYSKNKLQATQVDFAQINEWLDEAIAITRNLSINLSPAILQGESLVDALNWLAMQMRDQYGLTVTVETNDVHTEFEDAFRILLFQVVREALFNVVKHAETGHAAVKFEQVDSHIRLTVSDEGKGFDTENDPAEAHAPGGLMNLQRRLKLVGCSMQIYSEPGKGTQVVINIPHEQARP
jgi:PAS domain S-box-containing protein